MSKKTIQLPDYFVNTGEKVPEGNGLISGAEIFCYNSDWTGAVTIVCTVKPNFAMPFGDVKSLISEIRDNLKDNEGIIEGNSGKSVLNHPYSYRITKRNNNSEGGLSTGISYFLGINIKIDGKVWYIDAEFDETGTTGARSAYIATGVYKNATGKSPFEPDSGWVEDPYDKNYTRWASMNYSEREEFDSMFPWHPLSELRKFVRFILENN